MAMIVAAGSDSKEAGSKYAVSFVGLQGMMYLVITLMTMNS